ncbi:sugar transferase [uncultured Prochlorococcus sp.]|uniref:sugar transferase n=1 Tax=uncultured Prochlorococcus sp. TaxID=159733 RepID=UPI00258CC398|nr:sugar transferase [uncultured Prochlorococcus sp.]
MLERKFFINIPNKCFTSFNLNFCISNRKLNIIYYLIDLPVFIFAKSTLNSNYSGFGATRYLYLFFLWGLISYIFGRLSSFSRYNSIFIKSFHLLINTIFSLISIFILEKILILFLPFLQDSGKDFYLTLAIGTTIIQFLRIIISDRLRSRKKNLYFIGKQEYFQFFKKNTKKYMKQNNIKIIHKKENIDFFIDENPSSQIIVISSEFEEINNIELLLKSANAKNIEILNLSDWFEKYMQKIPILNINLSTEYKNIYKYQKFLRLKRFGDLILSTLLILLTFPIIILAAILIKIEDNGPIFYRQTRTGIFEKEILITKLRSMKINSEKNGAVWANKNDIRITKIGKIIRKLRIDELPQLWSVLKGDMSLIGPRPERPELEKKLNLKIPNYKIRHLIKPGLSGWAQVNYPYGSSIFDSSEKLSYDLFYIRNQSIWLDILIFFKTIKTVIRMKGL